MDQQPDEADARPAVEMRDPEQVSPPGQPREEHSAADRGSTRSGLESGTAPASTPKVPARKSTAGSAAAKARAAKARAAKKAAAAAQDGGSDAARPAGGTSKSTARRSTPVRRTSAPKPASQAASLVASSTLAPRSTVADDILHKWERTDEAPEENRSDEATEENAEIRPDDAGAEDAVAGDVTDDAAAEDAVAGDEAPENAVGEDTDVSGVGPVDADLDESALGAADGIVAEDELEQNDQSAGGQPMNGRPVDGPLINEHPVTAEPLDEEPDRVTDPTGDIVRSAEDEVAAVDDVDEDLDEDLDTAAGSATTVAGHSSVVEDDTPVRVLEDDVDVDRDERTTILSVQGLSKSFDGTPAVDSVDLTVRAGSIFGIVGPNGAGKTTTLSMITGLLRPDAGRVLVHGADVWKDPVTAKRNMGVLPDRLRLFDRLTGGQLLYYSGSLRGLDRATVRSRSADLAVAFGLEDALSRLVTDYSAGMTKKIALAAAMIHSPRILILDEPFEAVDPVSAANVIEILQKYAAAGGTVVMSSHSMDLIQRICDSVTIIVHGEALASGTMDEVRDGGSLEDRFVKLAGGRKAAEGMEWLHSFSG